MKDIIGMIHIDSACVSRSTISRAELSD